MRKVLIATFFSCAVSRHLRKSEGLPSVPWDQLKDKLFHFGHSNGSDNSSDTFKDLLTDLTNHLADQEGVAEEEINARRDEYLQQLRDQRQGVVSTEERNEEIAQMIETVHESVQEKHKQAEKMVVANQDLVDDLHKVMKQINLARDFGRDTVTMSNKMLDGSSEELKVLGEFKSYDEDFTRDQAIAKFFPDHEVVASLRRVPNEPATEPVNRSSNEAQDLLNELQAHIKEKNAEKSTALATLKESFQELSNDYKEQFHTLIKTQQALNQTLSHEQAMDSRMDVAIEHLRDTRYTLSKRINAVRMSAKDLGAEALPWDDFANRSNVELEPEAETDEADEAGDSE